MSRKCFGCGTETYNPKFCSLICQGKSQWNETKAKIERGEKVYTRAYRQYLIERDGPKCSICGWSEINPLSGKIPIEIDHIDGNSENNQLENLRLLCPNHQSLTPTYKILNKGNGRWKRRQRYLAGKSY